MSNTSKIISVETSIPLTTLASAPLQVSANQVISGFITQINAFGGAIGTTYFRIKSNDGRTLFPAASSQPVVVGHPSGWFAFNNAWQYIKTCLPVGDVPLIFEFTNSAAAAVTVQLTLVIEDTTVEQLLTKIAELLEQQTQYMEVTS